MNQIEQELKELIVEVLNLEDVSPSDIVSEDPLFNDGLGLDSIDALELGIAIKACLLYTSPSPRDRQKSRMPSSA